METWQSIEAGRHFRTLLEGVRRGEWQLVGDRGRAEAVLASVDETIDLLGPGYRFRPKTSFGERGVEIWLPELGVHVAGTTLEEARAALAGAMIVFARDWEEERRHTSGPSLHAGYARRIQLAGDDRSVLDMLDRDAESEGLAAKPARAWTDGDETKPRRWMGPHDRIALVRDAQSRERESE